MRNVTPKRLALSNRRSPTTNKHTQPFSKRRSTKSSKRQHPSRMHTSKKRTKFKSRYIQPSNRKRPSKIRKIKSTNNIRDAVVNKKSVFAERFLRESVDVRKRKRGWNFKLKNYYMGGTAEIYARIEGVSQFPVDEDSVTRNKFRLKFRKESGSTRQYKSLDAWYEAFFLKKLNLFLGRMSFQQAKLAYEKAISVENIKFEHMARQFSSDNREQGIVERVRWYKLIAY